MSIDHVCEALGLAAWLQTRKLGRRPWAHVAPVETLSGSVLCVDLPTLPLWLATVGGRAVPEKLTRYQRDAAAMIARHFLGGSEPVLGPDAVRDIATVAARAAVGELVGQLGARLSPSARYPLAPPCAPRTDRPALAKCPAPEPPRDPWEKAIDQWLDVSRLSCLDGSCVGCRGITMTEVLWGALRVHGSAATPLDRQRVGRILAARGWGRRKRTGTRTWVRAKPCESSPDDPGHPGHPVTCRRACCDGYRIYAH